MDEEEFVQFAGTCPAQSANQFVQISMAGVDAEHPDSAHGDFKLDLRNYQQTDAVLDFVELGGVGSDPPQLAAIFADRRQPGFTSVHRVFKWDWECGDHGCATTEFTDKFDVSLAGLATNPGETISIPSTNAESFDGGFIAAVLYAEPTRLTVAYTRDGTVANGYSAHLENFCVDPNLVALYRQLNAAGRGELPGLKRGEIVGSAFEHEILVAIRDKGTFMDPRSRGDWWR